MATRRTPSRIFPKVSTLPRQRTEAAHYLDMYKLTVEKKRIQQELDNINQKQQRLQERLAEIDHQLEGLGDGAEALREQEGRRYIDKSKAAAQKPTTQPMPTSNIYLPERSNQASQDEYSTVVLDY
jgi:DNA gyrase/topoisomerase IV subunit A